MDFRQRTYQLELLDQPDIPFPDIQRNMYELDVINTLLGGHQITVSGIRKLAAGRTDLHVCEIGCGGGDNLRAIAQYLYPVLRRRTQGGVPKLQLTGIDLKPTCIQYARERWTLPVDVNWICSDYRNVSFAEKPDIIFSSLFCHHFTDDGVRDIFSWCAANSGSGFFLNDLHRHPLAYHSIRLLTRMFSRSYLVKNDAPLSVARGFSRAELERFIRHVPGMEIDLHWKWAFRWLLLAKHRNSLPNT